MKFTKISHTITKKWKKILIENRAEACTICIDHHLTKNNLLLCLKKVTLKELYSILVSQQYFKSLFPDSNLDWKLIYLMPKETTRTTSFRAFQYKILNYVLYLNKIIFRFGKSPSPLCSFCKLHDGTLIHVFTSCNQVISLWIKIKLFFSEYVQLAPLSPKIPNFRLVENNDKSFLIQIKKVTGFKSLRINYWEINQLTSKYQMNFLGKTYKKVHKKETSPPKFTYSTYSRDQFQLKLTIFIFWTKLVQKRYFQPKTDTMNTTIEFCIFEYI